MFAIVYHYYDDGWTHEKKLNSEYIYYPEDEIYTATNIKLELEMGKAGSLTFTLPATNPYTSVLKNLKSTISVMYLPALNPSGASELWRGRIISIERDLFNNRVYTCEGALNFLNDVVLPPDIRANFIDTDQGEEVEIEELEETWPSKTAYIEHIINLYNSKMYDNYYRKIHSVSTEFENDTKKITITRGDFNSVLYEINRLFISGEEFKNGGYLEIDFVNNIHMQLTYHLSNPDMTGDYDSRIEFGENLLDFTETIDSTDVFSAIRYTFTERTEDRPFPAQRIIEDAYAEALYGHIERAVEIDSWKYLDAYAQDYLTRHTVENVNLQISALDFGILTGKDEPYLKIGWIIDIVAPLYNLDEKMACVKISYDLNNMANTMYTFGKPNPQLSDFTYDTKLNTNVKEITNLFT